MLRDTHHLRAAAWLAGALAVVLAGLPGTACAESRLDAHYKITVAGIAIGQSELKAAVGGTEYSSSAQGQASGMLRFVVSGEGSVNTRGTVVDGKLVPASFTSSTTEDTEKAAVTMTLADGDVKDLTAETSESSEGRVPLTAENRKGIIDPLSALLIRVDGAGDAVAATACQRTLPIFDGRRRFDLALSFKRIDQVKAEKGYAGPAVVCAVTFKPIAGYRPDSKLLKYLTDGRDIELALAPMTGTRFLAPFRFSVESMLGNMVVDATSFETTTAAASAPLATASK